MKIEVENDVDDTPFTIYFVNFGGTHAESTSQINEKAKAFIAKAVDDFLGGNKGTLHLIVEK